jgi:hypothetical protein
VIHSSDFDTLPWLGDVLAVLVKERMVEIEDTGFCRCCIEAIAAMNPISASAYREKTSG